MKWAGSAKKRYKTVPSVGNDAVMDKATKASLWTIAVGVFLVVGPIIQTTFLPRPEPNLPKDASTFRRGFAEGSEKGANVGSVISVVLGMLLVVGTIINLVQEWVKAREATDSGKKPSKLAGVARMELSGFQAFMILLVLFIAFVIIGPMFLEP